MDSSKSPSWHDLSRRARVLEGQLERNLHAYSRLNASFTGSDSGASAARSQRRSGGLDVEQGSGNEALTLPQFISQAEDLENRIQDCLVSLTDVTDQMARVDTGGGGIRRHGNSGGPASGSKAHAALLKRYGEVLCDHTAEFRSTRANITKKRNAAQLFQEMRDGSAHGVGRGQAEPLLRERAAIAQSNRAADEVLEQALATNTSLRSQMTSLRGSSTTFNTIAGRFPVVNSIMDAINRRRSRNNTVLALVIASCICFTLWYMFR